MSAQKRGLGRGLDAIFSEQEDRDKNGLSEVDINALEPNKDQPRKSFDAESLDELAESVKTHGILQPIIVTKMEDGYYKIVAGERRYRAARLAKLKTVPVIVRELSDLDVLQLALVENLQRKDLNALEEAMCFKKLMDEFSLTQEDVAERVGKSRPAVANSLRLLGLDKRVQKFLQEGRLSTGHAKVLLGVGESDVQFELAEVVIENELSVRQTEELLAASSKQKKDKKPKDSETGFKDFEDKLASALGTKVNIKHGKRKGKIEIEYYSASDLDRLLYIISK